MPLSQQVWKLQMITRMALTRSAETLEVLKTSHLYLEDVLGTYIRAPKQHENCYSVGASTYALYYGVD